MVFVYTFETILGAVLLLIFVLLLGIVIIENWWRNRKWAKEQAKRDSTSRNSTAP